MLSSHPHRNLRRRILAALVLSLGLGASLPARAEAPLGQLTLDWATYNPLSLLIKQQGLIEREFSTDGTKIRWVQSLGSNKALEFLSSGSVDVVSSAGAAALLGRIGGNPVKAVGIFSQPEWTALVTRDAAIKTVADLKGKRIAVTRGTDPHIFLVRALAEAGLGEKDVKMVLLQHADGRAALARGDVDAWAGLDPMMASAESDDGARLFYRKPEANTFGVLDTREDFAEAHPDALKRILTVYEDARRQALAHPEQLQAALVQATRLPEAVIARQLARTRFDTTRIGAPVVETIRAAGLALQAAGVIKADVDVAAATAALVDGRYVPPAAP
jgi:sulfonate transport system substrate-binding protein